MKNKRPFQIHFLQAASKQMFYNPETGEFHEHKTGKVQRPDYQGHVYVEYAWGNGRRRIRGSRLAFYMFYGYLPEDKYVEHRNGDNSDNSIDNLYLVPRKNYFSGTQHEFE